jgi:antitoxin component YwqK of YwqJK toxin-antitoxin module|tara:strand:+ start:298 stop:546 length:249 start_codon:yes stop_codon:yes gene_type:complete
MYLGLKKYITYHDNGAKWEEGFYKDGKREGECISYYENGEKELVGYFKKGKPCGIWMYWDKDGYYDWVDMDGVWAKDCFYHK